MNLKRGDIITYSDYGIKCLSPRLSTRQGKVVRCSSSKDCLMVSWTGRKTHESIHKSFLKKTIIMKHFKNTTGIRGKELLKQEKKCKA